MDNRSIWAAIVLFLSLNCYQCDDAAVVKAPKSTDNYRLPRTLFPEYYKLNVFTHLNDDQGFKYYGDVRITVIKLKECFYLNFKFYFFFHKTVLEPFVHLEFIF